MEAFDYQPTTRVIFGAGALERLGGLAVELGGARVLLVTDAGIVSAGLAERATASLRQSGLDVSVYDGTGENPSSEHVEAGVDAARAQGEIDLIVGLGGGSAMDCAKGVNFVLTNGGRIEDYHGMGKAPRPMLPAIGIPTTAGTGSEAQSYALISRADTHEKMACGDLKARFRSVILDPDLTASVPRSVAAATGIDAIAHAVESYVSTRRNAISQLYSREAWGMLTGSFERSLAEPGDGEARGQMLLGAHLAGAAIENAMLGAAHACANPLTARYGIAHGVAVALMLPAVIRFNKDAEGFVYQGLAEDPEGLAVRVTNLRKRAGLPGRLGEAQIPRDALATLAQDAAGQWTGTFNPRRVGEAELLRLYEAAY